MKPDEILSYFAEHYPDEKDKLDTLKRALTPYYTWSLYPPYEEYIPYESNQIGFLRGTEEQVVKQARTKGKAYYGIPNHAILKGQDNYSARGGFWDTYTFHWVWTRGKKEYRKSYMVCLRRVA